MEFPLTQRHCIPVASGNMVPLLAVEYGVSLADSLGGIEGRAIDLNGGQRANLKRTMSHCTRWSVVLKG